MNQGGDWRSGGSGGLSSAIGGAFSAADADVKAFAHFASLAATVLCRHEILLDSLKSDAMLQHILSYLEPPKGSSSSDRKDRKKASNKSGNTLNTSSPAKPKRRSLIVAVDEAQRHALAAPR